MFNVAKAVEKLGTFNPCHHPDISDLREILLSGQSDELEKRVTELEDKKEQGIDPFYFSNMVMRVGLDKDEKIKILEQRIAKLEAQYELNEKDGYVRFGTMKFKIQKDKPVTSDHLLDATKMVEKPVTEEKPFVHNDMIGMPKNDKPSEYLSLNNLQDAEPIKFVIIPRSVAEEWIKLWAFDTTHKKLEEAIKQALKG